MRHQKRTKPVPPVKVSRKHKNLVHFAVIVSIAAALFIDDHASLADWQFLALSVLTEVF